ncbi:MAG TPA: hypothetical protein VLH61_09015 [Bacteroidales bacterium]|nr:hypothetical protein [Bacteroidales bacterium]
MFNFVMKCPSIGGNLLANTYRDEGGGRRLKTAPEGTDPGQSLAMQIAGL